MLCLIDFNCFIIQLTTLKWPRKTLLFNCKEFLHSSVFCIQMLQSIAQQYTTSFFFTTWLMEDWKVPLEQMHAAIPGSTGCMPYWSRTKREGFCHLSLSMLWWWVQWNLNNPITYGAVLLGCNKEVAGIQLTSTKRSHPLLAQMAALQSTST